MNNNLVEYLNEKKCFKLICGAGNSDIEEIKRLCALYAKAGARFFDVSASVQAVKAAKEGFRIAGKEDECFICVSVGVNNDPHLSKCKIDRKKCSHCKNCVSICGQKAIVETNFSLFIDERKCIGCAKCLISCPQKAIESYSNPLSLENILPPIIKEGVDCIEYHAISDNKTEILSGWKTISGMFDGVLSVCANNSKMGYEELISCLTDMKNCCNNVFMIQADGLSMSGSDNDYKTTLQAVAAADIMNRANITPHIIMSGGTNAVSIKLAKLCGVNISGMAIGSYARKIVKEYIDLPDFLTNKSIFNKALKIAKELVNSVY